MPTPLPWITDRLPTAADCDEDGDVIILIFGNRAWCRSCWGSVEPGQPWLAFTPPATASTSEPTPSTPAPLTRRIVSITRTVYGAIHTIDAVADDGTAWWKVPGEVNWTQLPPLPDRDAQP